jgi:hypothetical protein
MTDDETSPLRDAIRAFYADPEQQAEQARKRAEADAALRAKTEGPLWAIVRHSPGKPAQIACPSCGQLVAQLPVSDGEVAGPIRLVAGFTNATNRHPSGLPWYVREKHTDPGGTDTRRAREIRGVVVVTCWCGKDCRVLRQVAYADMVGDAIRNDPSHPQHRMWAERPIDWRNRE